MNSSIIIENTKTILNQIQDEFFSQVDSISNENDAITQLTKSIYENVKLSLSETSQNFTLLPKAEQKIVRDYLFNYFSSSFNLVDSDAQIDFLLYFADFDFILGKDIDAIIKSITDANSLLIDGLFQDISQTKFPVNLNETTIDTIFNQLKDFQKKELLENIRIFKTICNEHPEIDAIVKKECTNLEGDALLTQYFLSMNQFMVPPKIALLNEKLIFKTSPKYYPDALFLIAKDNLIETYLSNITKTGDSKWEGSQGVTHPISSTLFSHYIKEELTKQNLSITQENISLLFRNQKNTALFFSDSFNYTLFSLNGIKTLDETYFNLTNQKNRTEITFEHTHHNVSIVSNTHLFLNSINYNKTQKKGPNSSTLSFELINQNIDIKTLSTFIYLVGFLSGKANMQRDFDNLNFALSLTNTILSHTSATSFNDYTNRESQNDRHKGRVIKILPNHIFEPYFFNKQEFPPLLNQLTLFSEILQKNVSNFSIDDIFANNTLRSNMVNITNFLYFSDNMKQTFENIYSFSNSTISTLMIERAEKEKERAEKEKERAEKESLNKKLNAQIFNQITTQPDDFWQEAKDGNVQFLTIFNLLEEHSPLIKIRIKSDEFLRRCIAKLFFNNQPNDFIQPVLESWKKEPEFVEKILIFSSNALKDMPEKIKEISFLLNSNDSIDLKKQKLHSIISNKI